MRHLICRTLAVLCLAVLPAHAHDYTIDDIHIDHPWSRPMPEGRDMGGGYMTLRNDGATADRLVSVSTPRAGRVELHETTIVDDVMRMRHLPDGIEIAPGTQVELKPGGLHVMFLEVAEPFAEGERITATLVFETAGEIEVAFEVEGRGAGGHEHDHDHHDDHSHGHGHSHGH